MNIIRTERSAGQRSPTETRDTEMSIPVRGIDEPKWAEARLRESEAWLRFAVESAGIGIWEQDITTGEVRRSARHAAIFGVDPASAWSHARFLSFVVPEERAMADELRCSALASETDWCIVCRIRRASDGATRWVEARGTPMRDADGEIRRYVGIISDTTERKEAEAIRLRQAEELERSVVERTSALATANARLTEEIAERHRAEAALMQAQRSEAIGQVVGGVAHCFNNLLASVIGNLDLLDAGTLGERPRRLLDRAMRAAWRGSALNQQLLAYARRQNLQPRPLDVNAMLAGMQEAVQRSVGEPVRIEAELAPELWPALGDPGQLGSVVLALALNARDAMPNGGRLRIATRNLASGKAALPPELVRGDYVLLTVADDGAGMPPDVLARACEPFFTTKDVGQGNGLGLAQVDGIARQCGGTVRLRSVQGAGTTVEVFLPRATETQAAGQV